MILAKAPIPGLSKTRLIPAIGPVGAARLQRRLTRVAVRTCVEAGLGPVTLWCTPDTRHRFFRALQKTTGIDCRLQPGGDLGHRMLAAFRVHCAQGPVLMIGTDCPALRPDQLRRAAQSLIQGDDAVVHPAEDGGYVLIGLREPRAALFSNMSWSTDRVMSDTRERAHAMGLKMSEFETLWDVDRPDDLVRLHAIDGAGIA